MKGKKISIILIVASVLVITLNTVVFALTLNDGGYYKYPVDLDYSPLGGAYYGRMYNAAYYWNSYSGKNYITYDSSSRNIALEVNDPQNYYGKYNFLELNGSANHQTSKFSIYLNAYILNDCNDTYKESTSSHELGHSLGLSDADMGLTIMNNNRNRSSIYRPQSDDIAAAAQNYSR